MADAAQLPKPDGQPARPVSPIARGVGRFTLRAMRWPGRRWVGAAARERSRRRGGYGFKVTGEDGVSLDAWFSPAQKDVVPRIPVVFCHGWTEVKELHFPLADRLNRQGHDVILYDHRAHGHSTGKAATFGVKERLDLTHVLDGAGDRGLVGDAVASIGFSLGASTVLQHAPTDGRIAGVVAFAPFVSFRTAIESFRLKLAPWVSSEWLVAGMEAATQEAGFELDEASTLEAVQKLAVPLMIVEGGRDRALPPLAHVRPLEAAKQNGELSLFTVDRAGHGSLMHRQWPGLNDAVYAFLAGLGK